MNFGNFNFTSCVEFLIIFLACISILIIQFRKFFSKNISLYQFFANISLIFSLIILSFGIFQPKIIEKSETNISWSNIVFTLDVSKSMNASDIKIDDFIFSRLDASKEFIKNFISKYPQNKYALVVFAWESIRILPFTNDINLFSTLLTWVDSNNVSVQWTNLISALKSAKENFTDENDSWLIVLISDWWEEKLELEKFSSQIQILTIWVWTDVWAKIPIWTDYFGNPTYKTYNWETIISKLSSENLKQIANFYNWQYANLSELSDFKKIEKILQNTSKQVFVQNSEKSLDLTRYLAIASFLFFILFLIFLILKNAKTKF